MNTLFIRGLIGMATLVAVLGLVCQLIYKTTNLVRSEHYWFDLFSPAVSQIETLKPEQLHYLITEQGLEVHHKEDLLLSSIVQRRIEAGQLVIYRQNEYILALKQRNENDVLVLKTEQSGRELYRLYASLIAMSLSGVNDEAARSTLAERLSEHLPVSVSKPADENLAPPYSLEALVDQGLYLDYQGYDVTAWVRLRNGIVYRVEMPDRFDPNSFVLILFLFGFIVAALFLAFSVVIKYFDQRLRNIETVASRIARGELDARVKYQNENDAVGRLGRAFNSMADHIERLMFVQKEMIHAVSHELRTPVARIRFGVQMIEDCQNPEMLRKQIAGIDGDIQELDELIDEILTYARLEQGGPILTFQEDNVKAIVEQVVEEQSSVKPDIKIRAEYKSGSEKWKMSEVETRYIHRSIQNLVGNATRYAKSQVRIVCAFNQDTCRIDVEDDGPGIPEADWEKVFTPFARLDDSRTRSSGGYGLGLSIVRRILYWHGGQAFLGTSEMGGAKFSLVWPRRQDRAV